MALVKIDLVDSFYSVGSSLFGRILLFFSAGWVGLLLGRVATAFDDWRGFLDPAAAMGGITGNFTEELLILVLWPIFGLLNAGADHVGWFFIQLAVYGVAFWGLILSEEPAPLWWLILTAFTSLLPFVVFDQDWNLVSGLVLAAFWIGLGAAGWWALQKYHPAVIEAVDDLMQGRPAKSEPPPAPRRKAPPGTWPKGVAGFDDDDTDEDRIEPD